MISSSPGVSSPGPRGLFPGHLIKRYPCDFFSFWARSRYLSTFSHPFIFICWISKNHRMTNIFFLLIDIVIYYLDLWWTRNRQIHPVVDKINKVTTGKQAMLRYKPWPMKNKHCVGVSRDQWKTSIAWVSSVTNGEQALGRCNPWPMKNNHCVGEDVWLCESRGSFKSTFFYLMSSSLATNLYRRLLSGELPVYILHRHRAVVYRSSNLCSSMWRGPQEYIAYEFVLIYPAVSCKSGSSHLGSFHDRW